jgi:hypothetical protein
MELNPWICMVGGVIWSEIYVNYQKQKHNKLLITKYMLVFFVGGYKREIWIQTNWNKKMGIKLLNF